MYRIGRITKTHGVRGELKVQSTTDFERFVEGRVIYYLDSDQKRYLKIKSVRLQHPQLLIKFEEINNLNEAEVIRGKDLFTDEDPTLLEDEYTKDQLVGLEVVTNKGEVLGKVVDLMFLPSQEVLVIKGMAPKNILIPFLKEFVLEVSDKIYVKLIEGLIW